MRTRSTLRRLPAKQYSREQAACFFPRSEAWLRWGVKQGKFTRKDGRPVAPSTDNPWKKHLYSLTDIRDIAISARNLGLLTYDELIGVVEKIIRETR